MRHTDHRATTERGTLTWKRRRRSNLHKLVIALARRVSRVVSNNSRHSHPLPLPNSSASVCYFRFVRSLNSFSTFSTVDDLYKHPPLPPQLNHVCVCVCMLPRTNDRLILVNFQFWKTTAWFNSRPIIQPDLLFATVAIKWMVAAVAAVALSSTLYCCSELSC